VGKDGHIGSQHQYKARDVLSFQVDYFHGDYRSILGDTMSYDDFLPLYNENIGRVVISLDTMQELGRRYRYDGLNRLRSVAHRMKVGNLYDSVPDFMETFACDKDGNITNVLRWAKGSVMDSLRYFYYAGNNSW